jgi:hypothetical protein
MPNGPVEILPSSAYFNDNNYAEKTEPLQAYTWDGLHPTHLGDTLLIGRFKIAHKLDHDPRSGTAWLVRDHRENKWRRLDIGFGSDEHFERDKKEALEEMALHSPTNPDRHTKHADRYALEWFVQLGHDGRHVCSCRRSAARSRAARSG